MKLLSFDMNALHIQAELPSLLGAPEHTLQHCRGNCMHCCRNAFTQVLQIPNLHLVHQSLCYPMQRRPRASDHASVLPRTVVSLVKSSVLGTSRWGNYAQCAQSAGGGGVRPSNGFDRPFSSVRSAKFATQWTLWCRVPNCDDVLTLLDSALSPVIWSPQFPATSTTMQNVSRHKHSQLAGTCWPNL